MKSYYKIVRNKMPQIIKKNGKIAIYKKLNKEDFYYYLKLKLKEKINNLIEDDNKEKIINNLSDIYEIIDLYLKENKINNKEIKKEIKLKEKKYGNYDKKIFLTFEE